MKIIDAVLTGENIKKLCEKNRYSVFSLSETLGVSKQAIYRWFSANHNNMPTIDNLVILSSLLHCSIDELVVTEEIEETPEFY